MRAARDTPKADVDSAHPARPRLLSTQHPVAASARVGTQPRAPAAEGQIDAKLHAIDELEEFRRHRLSELQAQSRRGADHLHGESPGHRDLKQSIAALSVESPQVTSLRPEARLA